MLCVCSARRSEGLNLHVEAYKVQPTWHDGGILQIVTNAETTATIHKRYGGNLGAYKNSTFADWIKDNNRDNYDEVCVLVLVLVGGGA